ATKPLPGIIAEVVDKQGHPVPPNQGGFLVIKRPWPSMMRTIYGDDERYKATYWSHIKGVYFTADGARMDEDGYIWVMGRVDDVLNVSGHRLSTMEVESALVHHPKVAEAAVVGRPDEIKGEAICCFVTLRQGMTPTDELKNELKKHVADHIGSLARPDDVRFTDALPKTRSGKIMRRLLRDIAAGRESAQDTTTLEDFSILAKVREGRERAHGHTLPDRPAADRVRGAGAPQLAGAAPEPVQLLGSHDRHPTRLRRAAAVVPRAVVLGCRGDRGGVLPPVGRASRRGQRRGRVHPTQEVPRPAVCRCRARRRGAREQPAGAHVTRRRPITSTGRPPAGGPASLPGAGGRGLPPQDA